MQSIAHVARNRDGNWRTPQTLQEHLEGTADVAEAFAVCFGSESWARAEALCHDAGKSRAEWQHYLTNISSYSQAEEASNESASGQGKVDHSSYGAKFAEEMFPGLSGRIISYCIAGHHAGLPDFKNGGAASLSARLQNRNTSEIDPQCRALLQNCRLLPPPYKLLPQGLDFSFWIRMLFSCLCDADYLDTEKYMDPDSFAERGHYLSLGQLRDRFNTYMDQKSRESAEKHPGPVHDWRQRVLSDCRNAAQLSPGFFSLTVPTGGGKTLSSMAFALDHAIKWKKSRIIYVIPYTSIIEQNAEEFRKAVGEDAAENIIEHQSNIDEEESTERSRLAIENWDAPVIVTTTVQFFESLFAARPGRCRKLHNIVNSVVILDEAQLLPDAYLEPILAAMKILAEHYGVSFVICTATQPALGKQDDFPKFPGLEKNSIREIIRDVPGIYRALKRVRIELPDDWNSPIKNADLAQRICAEGSSLLCIVPTKDGCRDLYKQVKKLSPGICYHLSDRMCAQHRSMQIEEIKEKLKAGERIVVISTSLVEAGVDFSFPVVYRAAAGLDSIAQAAGRCNREGELGPELGKVVIYVPERQIKQGFLRKAADTTMELLKTGDRDPLDYSIYNDYFSRLYWKSTSLDEAKIMQALKPDTIDLGMQFRTAAERFQIIPKGQKDVLVPYGKGTELIRELKAIGPKAGLIRKLQRYTVSVYQNEFEQLKKQGSLCEVWPGLFALSCEMQYSGEIGLLINMDQANPEDYITHD